MAVTMRKFNPGFMTDEELVASFCVRTNEFEAALETLRECDGSANPHRIVIGPRGSGKTCLLLRIAAELRRDEELSNRFFPVVFAEESYEVATAGEFWLECLSRLAGQAPRSEDTPDLRLTVGELRTIRDDKELGDRCLGALLDFADREGKRLVLVVENLNMIFGDMMDAHAGWRLRHVLQTEPRIFLMASATSRFDEIDSPDRALHDLFRIVLLRPLDTEECAVLWERVSGRSRAHGTIDALRILTGGSPRLLAILARFGAGLSFRELMAELLDLVDDHTEYFKSHLEALPPQERRVYLALADLWKPATTREISDRARLGTSKCSAQLARLTDRGSVEVVGGGARRKQYYLTERLYNIYYLMRRSRRPEPLIEALVRFMEAYYSTGELKDFGVRLAQENSDETADFQRPALMLLLKSPALAKHRDELLANFPEDLTMDLTRGMALSSAAKVTAVCAASDVSGTGHADEGPGTSKELDSIRLVLAEAVKLAEEHRTEDALAKCDEIVGRFGDGTSDDIQVSVAEALILKGDILEGVLSSADEQSRTEDVFRHIRSDGSLSPSQLIAQGLNGEAGVPDRLSEALETYDELLHRFGKSDAPALLEPVLMALIRKGIALIALDQPEAALACCNEVISRSRTSDDPSILKVAAVAIFTKGAALLALDRAEEAAPALTEAINSLENSDVPGKIGALAQAHLSQGYAVTKLGRPEEALAPWDTASGMFRKIGTPRASVMAMVALTQKAFTLATLGQIEEALTGFDDVLRQCEGDETPGMPEIAAMALHQKGHVLGKLNRVDEALAARDEFLHRYGRDDAPIFQEMSARSLLLKGELLEESGRQEEALAVLGEAVNRFKESTVPKIRALVANALALKGEMQFKLNRLDEALASWDDIKRLFGRQDDPVLVRQVSAAMVRKGFSLHEANRPTEALCAFDEAMQHMDDHNTKSDAGIRGSAHGGRGFVLDRLGRTKEALEALGAAAQLFEQCENSEIRDLAGLVLVEKAAAEMKCKRFAAALGSSDQALALAPALPMEKRLKARAIRARAAMVVGKSSLCVSDIKKILVTLPEFRLLPKYALQTLMWASVGLGEEQVLELVRNSPSATLLLPLATALQQELGEEPRVAREVEEVSRDIRRELAEMRKQLASG